MAGCPGYTQARRKARIGSKEGLGLEGTHIHTSPKGPQKALGEGARGRGATATAPYPRKKKGFIIIVLPRGGGARRWWSGAFRGLIKEAQDEQGGLRGEAVGDGRGVVDDVGSDVRHLMVRRLLRSHEAFQTVSRRPTVETTAGCCYSYE